MLEEAQCAVCSRAQGAHTRKGAFHVCKSWCAALWRACGESLLADRVGMFTGMQVWRGGDDACLGGAVQD